ncbi:TPA: hypothetical protein ACN30N_003068 [Vibrio campbellii]
MFFLSIKQQEREQRLKRYANSDGTSEAFEKLTGKKPQSFEVWLEENKAELQKLANI